MPPKLDAHLEGRILKAAQRIWHLRGEHGLTLRAIAKDAGTSTPTVYKRFRNKGAILQALAGIFQQRLNEACFTARSIEEVCEKYLAYAEENPQEYQLLWRTWSRIFNPDRPRPGYTWFIAQLAQRFGGQPEEYTRAFYAFFLLGHGAASLLTIPRDESARLEVQQNFLAICGELIRNIQILRTPAPVKQV
jgi:AcrR family transcriptional regulator